MSEPIEITRYPNRRLYDRSTGQYVTLQELEEKIRAGQDIVVRDSKSGDDLTRSVLTQMLLERHPERMDLFPVSLLHHLLRANDMALEWTRTALRQSLAFFESLPQPFPTSAAPRPPDAAPTTSPAPAFDWMTPLFAPFWPAPPAAPASTAPASTAPASTAPASNAPQPAAPPPSSPDAALAERLEQLERRLRELEANHAPSQPTPR